jgi:hypothetical protein
LPSAAPHTIIKGQQSDPWNRRARHERGCQMDRVEGANGFQRKGAASALNDFGVNL